MSTDGKKHSRQQIQPNDLMKGLSSKLPTSSSNRNTITVTELYIEQAGQFLQYHPFSQQSSPLSCLDPISSLIQIQL